VPLGGRGSEGVGSAGGVSVGEGCFGTLGEDLEEADGDNEPVVPAAEIELGPGVHAIPVPTTHTAARSRMSRTGWREPLRRCLATPRATSSSLEGGHGRASLGLRPDAEGREDAGVEAPEIRYARTVDGVHIAYQVAGDGPMDLVVVASGLGLGRIWDANRSSTFPMAFATFSRLILLDRRGTGLSDHIIEREQQLALESQMEDVRAVMDAAGSERAVLAGFETGFAVAAMFAATYPERTVGLVAYAARARELWAPDYPFGMSLAESDADLEEIERSWGTSALARDWLAYLNPAARDDEREVADFVGWMQAIGGPGDAVRWATVDREIDLRDVLGSIRVPTLVLHSQDDLVDRIEHGQYLAEHIPGAALREIGGTVHQWDRREDLPREVERFLATLHAEEVEFDRYLATVLFTDIVGSTELAAANGDAAWRTLLERHHHIVRGVLARYRGTEMDTAGDGFFATFDGPARAVRCAIAITEGVRELGIDVRAGVHIGEMQTIDGKAGGIAVTIGSRIMATAGRSEVLVSQTVKDLVAGSGLAFEEAGEHELKGVPDRWRLYRVVERGWAPIPGPP
jgi:class 3 adenylate cyclase